MAGEIADLEVEELILRCLRDFHPVKADMDVVVSNVQRAGSAISVNQISENVDYLRDRGWIEQSVLKAPSGSVETYRLKITPPGIEHLRAVEMRGVRDLSVALAQVKNQLAMSCDELRSELEELRRDLEGSKGDLEEMKALAARYREKVEAEGVREEQLILRVLSGDEKAVYRTILDAGGEMLQKDLVVRVRMSNAKVSRTIDRLEGRGILTKERQGATNRLRIAVSSNGGANPLQ